MGRFMAQSAAGQGLSQYFRVLGASEDRLRDHTGGSAVEGTP